MRYVINGVQISAAIADRDARELEISDPSPRQRARRATGSEQLAVISSCSDKTSMMPSEIYDCLSLKTWRKPSQIFVSAFASLTLQCNKSPAAVCRL